MSEEKLNAFYELINGFEIVGTLTEDGKKFIKEGVQHLQQEKQQLREENYRLEHNEKVLLQREERAINYIDQVIMYKPCAREIDEESNTLIGILRGGNNG